MRNRGWAGLAVLAGAVLLLTRPAAAVVLTTNIDLNYSYDQENLAGDVSASTTYNQKYEIKYETSLATGFDFLGAVRLELEDAWHSREAATSKLGPTLEVQAKSSQASIRMVYEGNISTTDAFQETAESKTYANSLSGELLMTPQFWPELKLSIKRQRDYELLTADKTTESLQLSLKKDFSALRLELNFETEESEALIPEQITGSNNQWAGKATYKEILYGGSEFELTYEKRQSASEDQERGIFTGRDEESRQNLKTRLKNSLSLTPHLTLGASWEYQVEQDLLVLDFDYKFSNKYQLDARWDLIDWFKVAAEARRETERTVNDVGLEDVSGLTDTLRGSVDLTPARWLQLAAKAEFKNDQDIAEGTGGSVDRKQEDKYEVLAKNTIGDFWDLTLNGTTTSQYQEGIITSRTSQVKGDLKLDYLEMNLQSSYGVSRKTTWDVGVEEPDAESQTREATIKFTYRLQLHEMFSATFSHEYGVQVEDQLDEVLNFERKLQFNEDTRISVVIAEIVRDLKLQGEVDRKGSDTQDDADPELVEVAYQLKLDWKLENLSLSSSFKYNDKGDSFDDLSFNTKVGWKGERFDVSGEYQFEKVFAELTDEGRKLNLQLHYKF